MLASNAMNAPNSRASINLITRLVLLFVAIALLIFYLPFYFPPQHQTLSIAYVAGFNNKVASGIVMASAILVFVFTRNRDWVVLRRNPAGDANMPRWLLVVWCAVNLLFTAGLSIVASASATPYGEMTYSLERANQIIHFGLIPFRDFEYAYGPLTLYLIAGLAKLFPADLLSQGAYGIALAITSCLGLVAVYYFIDSLVPGRRLKVLLFCLYAVMGVNATLGVQYTLFRYGTAFAALVVLSRIERPAIRVAFAFFSGLITLAISPETGIAFIAGTGAAAILLHPRNLSSWYEAAAAASPFLLLIAIFGQAYLLTFASFASGYFNFIVPPAAYICLYLIAAVVVVPMGFGPLLRSAGISRSLLISTAVASLALVSPALGRCDFGHVICYGFGFFVLSFAVAARVSRSFETAWFVMFASVCLIFTALGYRMYFGNVLTGVNGFIKAKVDSAKAEKIFDWELKHFPKAAKYLDTAVPVSTQDLSRVPAGEGIATPLQIDKITELRLRTSNRYSPEYFQAMILVYDSAAEDRKIASLDRHEWALLPKKTDLYSEDLTFIGALLMVPLRFEPRHAEFIPGGRLLEHLRTRWRECPPLTGSYRLFENPDRLAP